MTHLGQTTEDANGRLRLQVVRKDHKLVIGAYGEVCVVVWNCKPTVVLFEEQRSALVECARRYPQRAMFLCVVAANSEPPESPIRAASAKMLRDLATDILACACVIEGTGFRASIARSVLTGMSLVARSKVPLAFFEDVPRAVNWLAPHGRRPLGSLIEQLDALRRDGG